MKYYLRVEGVNLANFVEDTQNLSTIRGGGLLLLDSIKEIEVKFKLKPITTGASSGLFELKTGDGVIAEDKLCEEIEKYLKNHPKLKHATFIVNISAVKNENEDGFIEGKEKTIALNRWNQMQSPSVVFPERFSEMVCPIDLVRPANPHCIGPDDKPISESVFQRWKYGRERKQAFYKAQVEATYDNREFIPTEKKKEFEKKKTSIKIRHNFVNDLSELSDDESKGKLHHKIAIIYLDGNQFGNIQRNKDVCGTAKKQQEFDDTLKGYRQEFLIDLIDKMNNENGWISRDKKYRLETLLWGGDEIIWVVPAWKGWEVLSFFYKQSKDWEVKNNALTHAAGLVFCHHNAPIHKVVDLAKKLAGKAKDKSRQENLFAYQVLESFDHITMDLDEYWESRLPGNKPILSGKIMEDYINEIPKIYKEISRGQIYRNVHRLFQDEKVTFDENVIESLRKLADIETTDANLKDIKDKIARHPVWLHLAELWDYLPQTANKRGDF